MKLKGVGVVLCLAVGQTGCAVNSVVKTDPAQSVSYTLYRGATLIDGTGGPVRAHSSILIAGDTIDAVYTGETSTTMSLPKNTKVVDASGWFVLPGLIDSHVHVATLPNRRRAEGTMRRYLYSGITSARDMAGDGRALNDLARASLMHEIAAPDLYYSALMAGPSFFSDPRTVASAQGAVPGQVPWMQSISDETNLTEAVSLARGTTATGIKIYANLSAELVRAISTEGRAQGIQVWSHSMVFPALPSDVVAANVDVVSHVCRIAYEAVENKPTEYHHDIETDYGKIPVNHPAITAVFDEMKRNGIVLDATLRLYGEFEKFRLENPDLEAPLPIDCPMNYAAGLIQQALKVGVDVSAGTDGGTAYDDPYPALHEELEVLVDHAGMTPLQAIRSATYVGAMTLGKEAEFGTIESGKKANLVFVERDPVEDISNLRSVVLTVKRGTEYPREDFELLEEDEMLAL